MTLIRDSGARITAVADKRGRQVEVDYVNRVTGALDDRFLPDFELAASAWAAAFCAQAGGCAFGTRTVNLAETVAVPGASRSPAPRAFRAESAMNSAVRDRELVGRRRNPAVMGA